MTALSLTSSASQWCFCQILQHLKSTNKFQLAKLEKKQIVPSSLPTERLTGFGIRCLLCIAAASRAPQQLYRPRGRDGTHSCTLLRLYLQMLLVIVHPSAQKVELLNVQNMLPS